MKKLIALFTTAALLLGLCACGGSQQSAASTATGTPAGTLVDDSVYALDPATQEVQLPGGATIAYAGDSNGISTGANMSVWRGIQMFSSNFHYTATSFIAKGTDAEAAEQALREASESGAALVVCNGETMAAALYKLQNNYPTVSYLLLDAEPHSADYADYTTAAGVHCALFQEEQAGYLAGYAAVMDGNTNLAFLGSEELPGIVRYCTGFLQGAEAAAEAQGYQVILKTWYCGLDDPSDAVTQRLLDWYYTNTDLIMVSGGSLAQSGLAAAQETDGHLMLTDYDRTAQSDRITACAVKNYSTVTQQELYAFFSNGGAWDQTRAGQSESLGYANFAVGLGQTTWNLHNFSQEQYAALYEELRQSSLKVERYSDMTTLPDTPNVSVEQNN